MLRLWGRFRLFAGPSLILLLMIGCGRSSTDPTAPVTEPDSESPPWFEDVTDSLGIQFRHDPGPTGTYTMPQIVGSGLAVHDLDGDGRPDLLFLTNGGPTSSSRNALYRQKADSTYEDVSAGSGLDLAGHFMGVAVGDIDNDGRPDLLITQYLGSRLFRNLGGMKFEDITDRAGINNPLWGSSAAFFDYDRDGRLDLFIVNYLDYIPSWICTSPTGQKNYCAPSTFPGTCSKLYHNRGPGPDGIPRFEDVTTASGIAKHPGPGLGITIADFDDDGWPDVFVANDGKPNRLWMNKRDGTFNEEGVARGVAFTMSGQAFAGMGIAVGDADNDGLLDLYVTHLTDETNTFWKQGPRGQFRDRTAAWQVTSTAWRGTGFGAVMADLDCDGYADLALTNGRVSEGPKQTGPDVGDFWQPYAERNQILANEGGQRFRDRSKAEKGFCGTATVGRGLVAADLNGDGALELISTCLGGRARVYRNIAPNRGHWLIVRAVEPALRRDALGAEVTLLAGDRRWFHVICPAVSYMASNPSAVHFGLGSITTLDRIEVRWLDGSREDFPGGAVDRILEIRKGEGRRHE